MIKRKASGRCLRLLLTMLLLLSSILHERFQLNIVPSRTQTSPHLFCAPSQTKDADRILANRQSGLITEYVPSVRVRTARCSGQRLTYFFALLGMAATALFISGRFFLRYFRQMLAILQKSLLIVLFLHKADGKIEALSLI